MKENKRKKDNYYEDDGRVFADMTIDGMPDSVVPLRKSAKRMLKDRADDGEKTITLTRAEKRNVFLGVATSYILVGLTVFGLLALFILFCIKVWFK